MRVCGYCRTCAAADAPRQIVGRATKAGQRPHPHATRYQLVTLADFRKWVARCRKLFPLSKPARATLEEPGPDLVGVCWANESGYIIRICPRLDRHHACETLLHEWAHLMRGEEDPDSLDLHDSKYWEKFGELYRAWHRTT